MWNGKEYCTSLFICVFISSRVCSGFLFNFFKELLNRVVYSLEFVNVVPRAIQRARSPLFFAFEKILRVLLNNSLLSSSSRYSLR